MEALHLYCVWEFTTFMIVAGINVKILFKVLLQELQANISENRIAEDSVTLDRCMHLDLT